MGYVLLAVLAVVLLFILAVWLVGERGRLLRPSTARVARETGIRRFLGLRGLHFYLYARWPYVYIPVVIHHLLGRVGPRGRKWGSDTYHGKTLTPVHARAIVTINRPIARRDLEQIVPYPTARGLVLAHPLDIVLMDCPCRHARANPCLPIRVCMIIGKPFTDFVLEHHPGRCQRVAPEEAMEVLEAEHRRGHAHVAWFKDVCLERFYAICNCCKCCCGGIEAMVRHGIPSVISSGYVARVDPARCEGCGRCGAACPFGAMQVASKPTVNRDICLGCGVCVGQCEHDAVQLVRDPSKGVPLDIERLLERQDKSE